MRPIEVTFRNLVSKLGGRISTEQQVDVLSYIDHGEWPHAVDVMADAVDVADQTLSEDEWRDYETVMHHLKLDPARHEYLRPPGS